MTDALKATAIAASNRAAIAREINNSTMVKPPVNLFGLSVIFHPKSLKFWLFTLAF
jgi:hypothetical protein